MAKANNTFIFLLFFVFLLIMFFSIKKQKKDKTNIFLSNHKNKDEVWRTIKQFLKKNNEKGKEIIDSYVVKRNHIDMIDPTLSNHEKENKRAEIRIRKFRIKTLRLLAKKNNIQFTEPKIHLNRYVIVFVTKNIKTNLIDNPRCIEIEVVSNKISKNKYENEIIINSELNYNNEIQWLSPYRESEKIRYEKIMLKNKSIKEKHERLRKKEIDKRLKKMKKK